MIFKFTERSKLVKRFIFNGMQYSTSPSILYGIISANVGVFAAWKYSQNNWQWRSFMQNNFLLSCDGVFKKHRIHTLITSTFSHFDTFHFATNMIALYFFGTQAIAVLGAKAFCQLYFGGGLISSASFVLWPYLSPSSWPSSYNRSYYREALGASGAVCAVVAWSIFSFPTSIVYLYFIIPVPAALFGVGYIANEVLGLYKGNTGVGNEAHLGGAVFGACYFFKKHLRRLR
jgi:membrane associated rhomboid family serine protease